MAKSPQMGRVKTRLGREIGPVAATAFYRFALAETLRRLAGDPRWRTWLAVTPDAARHEAGLWPAAPPGAPRIPQGAGDLGARMTRIFATRPAGPVVIVGSDIPGLRPAHIARAFRQLGAQDAVFGPAEDGGYWLVGLARRRIPGLFAPGLFEGVRWSTTHALKDTVTRFEACGIHRIGYLERLRDVDSAEDWRAWRAAREGRQGREPQSLSKCS